MARNQELLSLMKSQTFGVEIEMYGITRYNAACLTRAWFMRNGADNISEVLHRSSYDTYYIMVDGREWKFVSDSSIRDPEGHRGCEMVTPILRYEDLDALLEIIRYLRKKGAKSDAAHACGVHIHIGANHASPRSLTVLSNLMSSHEALIARALELDENRLSNWCCPISQDFIAVLKALKPTTESEFRKIWYSSQGECDDGQHYNATRYHMLNLHSVFTKGTIEFRLFQFQNPDGARLNGLHAGRLKAYIQFCLALCAKSLVQSRASSVPNEASTANPAFAMRTWFSALGLEGDEFKTCRQVFCEKLPGDSAWRYGRPARNRRGE